MSKTLLFTSLIALLCFVGCGTPVATKNKPAEKAGEHAHDHPSAGPHQGQLIELGKEYHAELVHDDATHTVTVYLLDGHAEKAVTSDAKELDINLMVDGKPVQFKLPAVPETNDKEGESSRYQLADEPLCEALDKKDVKGQVNLSIGGKNFIGELSAHDHDHDHKH